MKKVAFHRNSLYEVVKNRCRDATWPNEDDATYYVADGSGISIERENIEVMAEDGKKNYDSMDTVQLYGDIAYEVSLSYSSLLCEGFKRCVAQKKSLTLNFVNRNYYIF